MDLLGDIGQADQLTTTRAENALLHQKVKDLTQQVQTLTFANAALQAEVDVYRQEAAGATVPSSVTNELSKLTLQESTHTSNGDASTMHAFLQSSGDLSTASYCRVPEYVFANLHQSVNPVCVTLSEDATLLISGAANGELLVVPWGAVVAPCAVATDGTPVVVDALTAATAAPNPTTPARSVHWARVMLEAPVVKVASVTMRRIRLVAAGLMDGRVVLVATTMASSPLTLQAVSSAPPRHSKYITAVTWGRTSDDRVLLVSSSADGTVHVSTVSIETEHHTVHVQHLQSFHWEDAVPCLCFGRDCIYLYIRNTPHVTCIQVVPRQMDNKDEYVVTKLHLNDHALDDHVSFAVLSLQASPSSTHDTMGGRYVAAATDQSRHFILDTTTGRIVKNLYGHDADVYSSPQIAWSRQGHQLYCNTQHEAVLRVYDIASGQSQTVRRHDTDSTNHPHERPIKDLYSSPTTDMVVTTSFDRNVVLWFPPTE